MPLSETVCYVAGMRTVFSVIVSVSCEMTSATGAGIFIICFSVDAIPMFVPPCISTSIRAELFRFLLRNDFYQLSALFTNYGILWFVTQAVTAAERTHSIVWNAEGFSYFNIADALQAHCSYLFFLLICHWAFLQSEGLPQYLLEEK